MSTGEITDASSMANPKRGGGHFMDSGLNRMIIWSAALLVVSVVGFAVYYYVDQSGSGDSGLAGRELAVAEQAVRDDPTNITNRLVLADVYFARQRYEDAATQYEAALAINAKSTLAHVGLGRALMQSGDFAGASESFQTVIDLSKEEDISGNLVQSSYYNLGNIALDQGKPDEAVEHFKQATTLERSDADSWYLLGTAYLQSGKLDEAIAALGQAVLFVPNFTEAYEALAGAFDQTGASAGALYARGMAAYSRGNLGDAADKLESAIESSPTLAEAHAGLGLVREIQGQKDAAIVAYQQALQLKPDDFLARNGLARLTGASSGTGLPANHPTAASGEGGEQGVTP
ncbi:MAG: tetratricopeptide repeat protein [Dehalococcoidia bacterium]|nr:tetratricopeptide repeat protein [Dehalococcoidia bacterium]